MSITVTATNEQYHRILSPTLRIPTDASQPIPVGLLACQRDPLLKRLQTTVISSVKHEPPPAPAGKKTKKAVIAPELPKGPVHEVILFDTVLFPEGGGQPTDFGFIKTSEGKEYEVVQVKRHGGHAVHYVQWPSEHEQPLQPGAKVTVLLGEKGWERRYDHMSMHTSQHVLSALLETRLNLPTLSWSLTASPSPCYVELPRAVTLDEIALIQSEANRLVFEDRKIHVEVQELDGPNGDAPKTEDGRAIGKALPSDYTGGVKRVIVIDGVDRNPCCGTHKPSLANLQLFLLPQQDSVSRAAAATTRLYFLAGPRLINHLTTTHSLLANTAFSLSCGAPNVPERVTLLAEERKRAEKRVEEAELALASYIAKDIVSSEKGTFKRFIHRTDESSNVLGFLSSISTAFMDLINGKDESYLVVISSSPSSQSATSQTVVLVFGSNDAYVKSVGESLKAKLGVKGGGKGPRWSGKYTGVWKPNKVEESMDEIFQSLDKSE